MKLVGLVVQTERVCYCCIKGPGMLKSNGVGTSLEGHRGRADHRLLASPSIPESMPSEGSPSGIDTSCTARYVWQATEND